MVPQAQLCRARLAHTLQLALDVHGLALESEAAAPLMEASTCLFLCVDCPISLGFYCLHSKLRIKLTRCSYFKLPQYLSWVWRTQNGTNGICQPCLLQACLQCVAASMLSKSHRCMPQCLHAWFMLTRLLDKPAGMCALLAWALHGNALRVRQAAEGWPWARWLLRSRLPARAGDHAAVLLRLAPDDGLGGAAGSAAHAADSKAERAGLRLLAMLVYTPGAHAPPWIAPSNWLHRRGFPAEQTAISAERSAVTLCV